MKKIILTLFLATQIITGQITTGIYQDAKLAFTQDDHGNDPFTLDAVILFKLYNGGSGKKWAENILVNVNVELADLNGGFYTRYGLGAGYKFEIRKLAIEPAFDYGRVVRWNVAFDSFNLSTEIKYKINKRFSGGFLFQYTQRNDLYYKWGKKKWTEAFYFGITYLILT